MQTLFTGNVCLVRKYIWLFSRRTFQHDEFLLEYKGVYIRELYENDSDYVAKVNGTIYLDAEKSGNLARYCNHCCRPNLVLKKFRYRTPPREDGEEPQPNRDYIRLGLFAKTEIKPGKELTWNYGSEYTFSPCKCPHCKK